MNGWAEILMKTEEAARRATFADDTRRAQPNRAG